LFTIWLNRRTVGQLTSGGPVNPNSAGHRTGFKGPTRESSIGEIDIEPQTEDFTTKANALG